MPDAIQLGLVDVINRARGTQLSRTQFLADCHQLGEVIDVFSRERILDDRHGRCAACGRYVWYPLAPCRFCGAARLTWTRVSGRGTLFSWSVVHHAWIPQFKGQLPFVTGLVAAFRAAVLGGALPWGELAISCGCAVVLFLTGCLYFRKVEDGFADII